MRPSDTDGGVSTFNEGVQFDYVNARVYSGPADQRADLGFSAITRTNMYTHTSTVSFYRQDKPYEGSLDKTALYDSNGALLSESSYRYSASSPPNSSTTVVNTTDEFSCEWEGGVKLPCRHRYYAFDVDYLFVRHMRDGTDDIPGENDIMNYFGYDIDRENWLFRPHSSITYRMNAAGTNVVLDATRTTYDLVPEKSTHVLKVERLLFDDAETATCTVIDDPATNPNVCKEKLGNLLVNLNGPAHWVTVFLTSSGDYDLYGNLTWFGGFTVTRDFPNPDWVHGRSLAYDSLYGTSSFRSNAYFLSGHPDLRLCWTDRNGDRRKRPHFDLRL